MPRKFRGPIALLALTAALAFAEDKFPTPPAGWWENLKAEDGTYPKATFEGTIGEQKFTMALAITKIEGANITLSTKTQLEGKDLPEEVQVLDAKTSELTQGGAGLPEDAKVTILGTEKVKVGKQEFDCTIYQVELEGVTMKVWNCPQLPVLLSGGNVRLETKAEGQESTIVMTSYEGKLIEVKK